MPKNFTHILFDLDGTISDSSPGIVNGVKAAFKGLGLPVPEDSKIEIGPPILLTVKKLLGEDSADLYEKAVVLYRDYYSTKGIHEYSLYPGVPEAIASLKSRELSLYVATGKARVYAEQMIQLMGLKLHFKSVHGCELNGDRTDKADLLSYMIKIERLPIETTVMIGDRKHDISAAKNVGFASAGVLWGYGSKAELESSGADVVCSTPTELLSYLGAF